jgi:hypothetical protein
MKPMLQLFRKMKKSLFIQEVSPPPPFKIVNIVLPTAPDLVESRAELNHIRNPLAPAQDLDRHFFIFIFIGRPAPLK